MISAIFICKTNPRKLQNKMNHLERRW